MGSKLEWFSAMTVYRLPTKYAAIWIRDIQPVWVADHKWYLAWVSWYIHRISKVCHGIQTGMIFKYTYISIYCLPTLYTVIWIRDIQPTWVADHKWYLAWASWYIHRISMVYRGIQTGMIFSYDCIPPTYQICCHLDPGHSTRVSSWSQVVFGMGIMIHPSDK